MIYKKCKKKGEEITLLLFKRVRTNKILLGRVKKLFEIHLIGEILTIIRI